MKNTLRINIYKKNIYRPTDGVNDAEGYLDS